MGKICKVFCRAQALDRPGSLGWPSRYGIRAGTVFKFLRRAAAVDGPGDAGLQPAPASQPEPMTPIRRFFVADLNAKGELRAEAEYRYEQLEQVPGAADLISTFSAAVWRSPEEFETA